MSDTSAPAVDAAPAPVSHEPPTPSDIGRMLSQLRQPKQAPESAESATEPDPELAPVADAAPAEQQPSGEVTETPDPAEEVPPIEPPRSWTQDRKEQFNALPRDLQEYVIDRAKEQDREFRTRQNEIADQRKAVTAEREAAEQAKQQSQAQLANYLQALQNAQQSAFADIRTMDDVKRLQSEDPFRFQAWQVQQMELQSTSVAAEQARAEKAQAEQAEWASYVQKQDELAREHIPELADKDKGPALISRVGERMKELGFKQDELNGFMRGEKISPFDYRFQRLLANDLKLSDIQKAKVTAASKPAPPVQRPGTAKPPGSAMSESIQNHMAKLERSGEVKDLGALIGALRRA